jgi:predicted RNase H-like HicB family nuclease
MAKVKREFTAVYKKTGTWYLGWIEEIPGANTQGRTLKEVKENLKEALSLILAANRELHRKAAFGKGVIREQVAVSV